MCREHWFLLAFMIGMVRNALWEARLAGADGAEAEVKRAFEHRGDAQGVVGPGGFVDSLDERVMVSTPGSPDFRMKDAGRILLKVGVGLNGVLEV